MIPHQSEQNLPHRERKRIETEITQIRPDPGSGINLIISIRDLRNKFHCIGQKSLYDGFKKFEYRQLRILKSLCGQKLRNFAKFITEKIMVTSRGHGHDVISWKYSEYSQTTKNLHSLLWSLNRYDYFWVSLCKNSSTATFQKVFISGQLPTTAVSSGVPG